MPKLHAIGISTVRPTLMTPDFGQRVEENYGKISDVGYFPFPPGHIPGHDIPPPALVCATHGHCVFLL